MLNMLNIFIWKYVKEFAEELHKPIIRKFEKKNVNSPFIDNI